MRKFNALLIGAALFVTAVNVGIANPNLVQNGDFSSITYTGSTPGVANNPYFGEFGSGGGGGPAPTLTVANWSTAGYNFVYNVSNVDTGTDAAPNNTTTGPFEAPGEFNFATKYNGQSYGNTYMWGKNNLATAKAWTQPFAGYTGNFVAGDGAFEQSAITQTITGLKPGQLYALTFYYGGAQQAGAKYTTATTEAWTVSLGTLNYVTPTINNNAQTWSGWTKQVVYYTPGAGVTSATLSFLASGTPNGQPPFTLLAGVDLEIVPDFSNWLIFTGVGAACIGVGIVHRRRMRAAQQTGA